MKWIKIAAFAIVIMYLCWKFPGILGCAPTLLHMLQLALQYFVDIIKSLG